MTQFKQYLTERSVFEPGNGKVISTDYESVATIIKKTFSKETGTLTIAAPGGAVAGTIVSFDISLKRLVEVVLQQPNEYDQSERVTFTVPTPAPTSIPNWLALQLAQSNVFAANLTYTLATNVITYAINLNGVQLTVTSPTATVTKAVTQAASNGFLANVGDGAGIFYRPEDNTTNPYHRPLNAVYGYANTSVVPRWFGVKRTRDSLVDKTNPYSLINYAKDRSEEIVRKGTIQVPLEVAASTIPATYAIVARYAPDTGFPNLGGFQIVDPTVNSFAPPVGTILVPRVEILAVTSNKQSAILKLF
jgi:hypothetical protein